MARNKFPISFAVSKCLIVWYMQFLAQLHSCLARAHVAPDVLENDYILEKNFSQNVVVHSNVCTPKSFSSTAWRSFDLPRIQDSDLVRSHFNSAWRTSLPFKTAEVVESNWLS